MSLGNSVLSYIDSSVDSCVFDSFNSCLGFDYSPKSQSYYLSHTLIRYSVFNLVYKKVKIPLSHLVHWAALKVNVKDAKD